MIVLMQKRPLPRVLQEPNERAMLESAEIKRCGVCMRIWEASALMMEDDVERCPRHRLGDRSIVRKAEIEEQEAQYIAECLARESMPQESIANLADPVVAVIRKITDGGGVKVYASQPLRLVRGVVKTLLLLGRNFSASDVITGPTDMTITVTDRTSTLTTLSITAGVGMIAGDGYDLVFNDVYYRDMFSVR